MKKLEDLDILKIDCSRKNNRYIVNDLMSGSFSNDHVVAENMKRTTSFDKGNTKQKRKPTKAIPDKNKIRSRFTISSCTCSGCLL